MVFKLYGHGISCYTRLIALILHEKQVPFEYHVVDVFRGEHRTAEHAKKHPFSYVPYIVSWPIPSMMFWLVLMR